jgi:radical SAM-linked protein
VVAETTDRPLDCALPVLATPAAPGPGLTEGSGKIPPLVRGLEVVRPAADRPRLRYRAHYTKMGRMRFLGHLDLSRLLLRALRRGGIEQVYSEGFNPKPRVAFGPALAVGVTSEAEYLDFDCYDRLDPDDALGQINSKLPAGVHFEALREIPPGVPALGESVSAARYRVPAVLGIDLAGALDAFRLRSPVEVRRERKGKLLVFSLDDEILDSLVRDDGSLILTLALHGDGASVRPTEVLGEILGDRLPAVRLVREELLVEWNGRQVNPLLAVAAARDHAA